MEEKKDKRRLFYLLILLALTAIMLSTTTYAWFTTNRIVSVSNIDVKVQTEGTLEISADGKDWKTIIDYNSIISVHNTTYQTSINQLPAYIKPVSTIGELDNNGKMKMFLGTTSSDNDGNYTVSSKKTEEQEGYGTESAKEFIAFDIFLKTTTTKDLYLTDESKIYYNGTSTGTENAARVAFVVEGNTASTSPLATIQALNTNNNNNVYIWEPNYDTHTTSGITNARNVYGITTTQTQAQPLSYDAIKSEFTEKIKLSQATQALYPNYFATVTPQIRTPKANTEYKSLFSLTEGITKVRVYMWLEGQDVDCENDASIGSLTLTLQFSTNPSK